METLYKTRIAETFETVRTLSFTAKQEALVTEEKINDF